MVAFSKPLEYFIRNVCGRIHCCPRSGRLLLAFALSVEHTPLLLRIRASNTRDRAAQHLLEGLFESAQRTDTSSGDRRRQPPRRRSVPARYSGRLLHNRFQFRNGSRRRRCDRLELRTNCPEEGGYLGQNSLIDQRI